ncbi:unnamed protein product [Orchesella dallaii]|uniref:Uncharacterized protein n=1 Tax=Orchesella dallaii TaxID=48710 RepID=A0ABP1QBT5_9HEXA
MVPKANDEMRMKSFFNCVATVMQTNLLELFNESLEEYTKFMCCQLQLIHRPKFIVRFISHHNQLVPVPSFDDWEAAVLQVVDNLVDVSNSFPRMEAKIFGNWDEGGEEGGALRPTIDPQRVIETKQEIIEHFREQAKGPLEFVSAYNEHQFLFNGENEDMMDNFIGEERTWEQLVEEVKKFHALSQDIPVAFDPKNLIGIFDVHCDELIKGLANRAMEVRDKFLEKMIHELHALLKEIVDEYEAISEKALSTPTSTEQLFALKEEIEKIREKTLPHMTQEVRQYLGRYMFIADFMQLSPILSKLQMQSIQWCNRMPYVLEEHYQIVAKKALEFQESLKLKRMRFLEELESYAKQVEEFQYFGELDDLPKYLKRAQALDAKLQAASDKADKFNREEEMFEFEVTNYPLRKQASNPKELVVKAVMTC